MTEPTLSPQQAFDQLKAKGDDLTTTLVVDGFSYQWESPYPPCKGEWIGPFYPVASVGDTYYAPTMNDPNGEPGDRPQADDEWEEV